MLYLNFYWEKIKRQVYIVALVTMVELRWHEPWDGGGNVFILEKKHIQLWNILILGNRKQNERHKLYLKSKRIISLPHNPVILGSFKELLSEQHTTETSLVGAAQVCYSFTNYSTKTSIKVGEII